MLHLTGGTVNANFLTTSTTVSSGPPTRAAEMEVSSAVRVQFCARARACVHVRGFVCAVQRNVIVNCSANWFCRFFAFYCNFFSIQCRNLCFAADFYARSPHHLDLSEIEPLKYFYFFKLFEKKSEFYRLAKSTKCTYFSAADCRMYFRNIL